MSFFITGESQAARRAELRRWYAGDRSVEAPATGLISAFPSRVPLLSVAPEPGTVQMMPAEPDWRPPETAPRDGTTIRIKRRGAENMRFPIVKARWKMTHFGGYWANLTVSAGIISDENVIGWVPI